MKCFLNVEVSTWTKKFRVINNSDGDKMTDILFRMSKL